MFSVEIEPGALRRVTLRDHTHGSLAEVCPERGGMATRLQVHGQEVFYMDQASFEDTSKNVRGGAPVLFPTPGKLVGDAWAYEGRSGSLKQHGFARVLPWAIDQTGDQGAASVTLRLDSGPETLASWPWAFSARYTYALAGDTLRIEQTFTNTGDEPMPFGAGFHPYFPVAQADKAACELPTGATRVFDNAAGAEIPFEGFALDGPEVDFHLIDHGAVEATFKRPGDGERRIGIACSEEFTHWVVWTVQGKDFVCVEPWTCPGDAINIGDRLLMLAPGQTRTLWTEIRYR